MVAGILCLSCGTSKSGRHAVSSEELQQAMKKLYRFSSKDINEKLQTEMPAPTNMIEVEKAAEDMAKTAEEIPGAIHQLDIKESDRIEFERLAAKLHDQSKELALSAKQKNLAEAKAIMIKINETCNTCHNTFRLPPESPAKSN
jgi:cytochrome c556